MKMYRSDSWRDKVYTVLLYFGSWLYATLFTLTSPVWCLWYYIACRRRHFGWVAVTWAEAWYTTGDIIRDIFVLDWL